MRAVECVTVQFGTNISEEAAATTPNLKDVFDDKDSTFLKCYAMSYGT
jgi:hypothetical protein